jgi:hygromycin-B 4-O-kinase
MESSAPAFADPVALLRRVIDTPVTDLCPLGTGAWSRAFSFHVSERRLVLRISRYEEDFAKDCIAAEWTSPTLPVPAMLSMGATGEGWYAITEQADGRFLEESDAAEWQHILPAVLDAVDTLRRINPTILTGAGLWNGRGQGSHVSWRDYLLDVANDPSDRRTHGWLPRLEARPEAQRIFDEALDALRDALPACPERRQIVHNDFVNRNVLVEGHRLTGVLDWGTSLIGDSLYDIALMDFWSPWFPAMRDVDVVAAAAARWSEADFHERIRAYQVHIGLEHIAYNAFLGRPDEEMARVCERTRQVMAG